MPYNQVYARCDVCRPLRSRRFAPTFVLSAVLLSAVSGCAIPPFFSTDNKYLLYLPGAERRSDSLPGYVRPWERVKLIEEKGDKGKDAKVDEKDILLVQLTKEYEQSESPNVRRAALEAIAKISTNYPNPAAEKIFRSALYDEDLNLNLSACRAWGAYCSEGAIKENNREQRKLALEILTERYKELPYSIAAGSEEENARRKDARVAILTALGRFKESDSPTLLETLELGLTDEKLDDGALHMAACVSLGEVTGKKYAYDGDAWVRYLAYKRGEIASEPAEPSLIDRMPKFEDATGMFK